MKQFTFAQRLRYWFDNTMAKGTGALIAWLGILSAVMILIVAIFVWIAAPESREHGLANLVWMGLMRTLDAGTMGGDEGSYTFLAAMLAITLGGIFIVSTLIGVLTTSVEGRIEQLRKGRSLVVENNHTVILGWSEEVFSIISELAIATENEQRPVIAILADQDKVEMEDALHEKIPDRRKLRIVCRHGQPIDLSDLQILNPQGSKSIIILSPEGEDADAEVIKTILAITNSPQRRPEPYHIVAEIRERKNLEVARLVAGKEAQLIESEDIIARVIAQTCRQSGLSIVYTELLDFGGDEIYMHEEPGLVGKTFGDALLEYETSCVIGLQFSDGRVALNPPMKTVIGGGDKVIAVSEDDDTVVLSGKIDLNIDTAAIRQSAPSKPAPERTLILGWNRRAPTIIQELDNYVSPGSELTVVAQTPDLELILAARGPTLRNQKLTLKQSDTTQRSALEELRINKYDHVVVLSYSDELDHQRADARTLVTLLHLRDIQSKSAKRFSIVSEMLDVRNRELAEVTQADDFIVSEKLISLLLAQISQNKDLQAVFADIFDPEGSEIYLRPAADYVATGQELNFYTVVEAARRRGHIAIGYRSGARGGIGSGVVVNPDKGKTVTFSDTDKVIVIAED